MKFEFKLSCGVRPATASKRGMRRGLRRDLFAHLAEIILAELVELVLDALREFILNGLLLNIFLFRRLLEVPSQTNNRESD